jgi:hypothetical protein
MYIKFLHTIFIISTAFLSFAQKANDSTKLLQTVKELHTAMIVKNIASINQQTDKILSYGHSNGWVENKKEFLENIKTNYITYKSITEDSIDIKINNTVAIVRFDAVIVATLKGNEDTFNLKVLEVWNKKANRWVLVARQSVSNKKLNN